MWYVKHIFEAVIRNWKREGIQVPSSCQREVPRYITAFDGIGSAVQNVVPSILLPMEPESSR